MSAGEPKTAGSGSADEESPARAATTDPAPAIPVGTKTSPEVAPSSSVVAADGAKAAAKVDAKDAAKVDAKDAAKVDAKDAPATSDVPKASVAVGDKPAAVADAAPKAGDTVADAVAKALPEAEASSAEASAEDAAAPVASPGIHVRLYGQTDVGLVREHNEDNFLLVDLSANVRGVDERLLKHTVGARGSLFAVCDGMGGAAAGEIASQMAVDTVHDIMTSGSQPGSRDDFARRLVQSVEEAGNRIFSSAKMDRTRRGMGTTSTVAGVVDKILFVGQVGDSRAYVLRGGKDFALITKDQSLVNQLIEAGQLTEEEAEAFEHSNIILQALGTAEQVTVDLTFLELKRGDRLMLCSDGLSGLVHRDMIKDVLATVQDPRACCATLIEMARAGGGHDNITVIVADFSGADLEPPDETSRVAYQQYPLPDSTDPRTSFPPRETGMKSGGPKPGSDVKGDQRRHARANGEGAGEGSKLWMWVAVALVLAVIAAVAYSFATSSGDLPGSSGDADGTPDTIGPVATPGVGDAPPAPVEVRIVSDVRHGELWVDGERRTSLNPSGTTLVELPPGAYAIEARTLEGASAATASLTVVAGAPMELTLSMPAGSADTLGEGPETVGVPIGSMGSGRGDGGTGAQPTTEPLEGDGPGPDAGRPRARRADGGTAGHVEGNVQGTSLGRVGTRPPPGPVPDNPFAN